jgi:hypothetical protein
MGQVGNARLPVRQSWLGFGSLCCPPAYRQKYSLRRRIAHAVKRFSVASMPIGDTSSRGRRIGIDPGSAGVEGE